MTWILNYGGCPLKMMVRLHSLHDQSIRCISSVLWHILCTDLLTIINYFIYLTLLVFLHDNKCYIFTVKVLSFDIYGTEQVLKQWICWMIRCEYVHLFSIHYTWKHCSLEYCPWCLSSTLVYMNLSNSYFVPSFLLANHSTAFWKMHNRFNLRWRGHAEDEGHALPHSDTWHYS